MPTAGQHKGASRTEKRNAEAEHLPVIRIAKNSPAAARGFPRNDAGIGQDNEQPCAAAQAEQQQARRERRLGWSAVGGHGEDIGQVATTVLGDRLGHLRREC